MISKKNGAEIVLNYQYLKDLRFENPMSPNIYTIQSLKPDTNVTFDMNATKLQNDIFEVELIINVEALDDSRSKEKIVMFNIGVAYAGVFTIKNVTDNLVQENLFIDCPTMIFPFMRRILADVVRDANFMPLILDLIDFEDLYNNKKNSLKNV
jgi:preprotein translocase subunit SecB